MSRYWDTSERPELWSTVEEPSRPSWVKSVLVIFAGLLGERQLEKVPSVFREEGLFLSVCVWTKLTLAGKNQNIDPMWKMFIEDVDFGGFRLLTILI